MSNNVKVKVGANSSKVFVNQGGKTVSLTDIIGIDISEVSDGAVLIYNESSGTFESKTTVENPNTKINGGHY